MQDGSSGKYHLLANPHTPRKHGTLVWIAGAVLF